ncbi:MAG: TIGR01459 family HAD-type hydrolase [Hyphomicrobiaceae bacterium]|nr:TIGR01459 family HAD-type hydrolase [Hyphomicrobiaceae bacterium]
MTQQTLIPIIHNISSFAPAKAWICDIWGVLHNGVEVYKSAVDACRQFRRAGGIVILVSNAPRPSSGVLRQFETLGIGNDVYDRVLTSGDVTRTTLQQHLNTPTLHIGPDRDVGLFDGLSIPRVTATDAKLILCSGLYDDTSETPDNYNDLLKSLAERKVPMLCANPDIKVDRGGEIIYCAGAVAARFSELGGEVSYAGKPHAPIYQAAYAEIDRIKANKVHTIDILAIGDGIETDIRGGLNAGLRTLYVTSAIHLAAQLNEQSLAQLFPDPAMRPTAATERLAW